MDKTQLEHDVHFGLHLGFKIAKLALQAASVAAAFCLVKEVHKVRHTLKKEHKHVL